MSLQIETELKLESEGSVLCWDGKLFVGAEDGSIKSFFGNLSPSTSWQAHAVQPFALTASAGKVFSSSNDGGVKVWTADGKKITQLTKSSDMDIAALTTSGTNVLITGDEGGDVVLYENNKPKAMYNVLEEVKDIQYCPPLLYTVRDLYVTVTEIRPESKTDFVSRHTLEGKAPIKLLGDWLLVIDRSGNNLKLHYATVEKEFKLMHEVKVSSMIVTSLAVYGDFVWTGGWDGHIRRWEIAYDQLREAGNINVGSCINALAADSNSVYAAVTGGRLLKIKGQ